MENLQIVLMSLKAKNDENIKYSELLRFMPLRAKDIEFEQLQASEAKNLDTELFDKSENNPFNSAKSFLLRPRKLCSSKNEKKLILILLYSKTDDLALRENVRRSWLKDIQNFNQNYFIFEHLFVLGSENGRNTFRTNFLTEILVNQDLLIGYFADNYWNLTYKTIFSVTFLNFFCSNADYVFKIDIDVFVRTDKFLGFVGKLPNSSFYGGFANWDHKPKRKRKNKWYVSRAEFSGNVFPPFCLGPAYFYTGDLIPILFNATLSTKFFKLEDVYMGLCLANQNKSDAVQNLAEVTGWYKRFDFCSLKDRIFVHGLKPLKWKYYKKEILRKVESKFQCSVKNETRNAHKVITKKNEFY